MEFFNKKQDVIDIELTSYGKQLLSRGLFKPAYYAFSDDEVLYDRKWLSGETTAEEQSSIEPRIQENTPQLKTQYRKTGAERAIYNHFDAPGGQININSLNTLSDLFEFSSYQELLEYSAKLNLKVNFAESEKLLENVLGTKSYFNDHNPAWNLLLYHGEIKNSTSYYQKNDIVTDIPQVNITLSDTMYKLDLEDIPEKILPEVKNIMNTFKTTKQGEDSFIPQETESNIEDLYFETFTVDDGKAFIVKDFLFISLEEQNVDFTKENFMVELYEVTTTSNANNGEEELIKMSFEKNDTSTSVFNVFNIETDKDIAASIACSLINKDKELKEQNIYTSNVFDCTEIPSGQGVNVDPYTNLPDADVGDTC